MIRPRLPLLVLLLGLAGSGVGCATKSDVKSLETEMRSEMRKLGAAQKALVDEVRSAFDSLGRQERRAVTGRGETQRQFDDFRELLNQLLELTGQNNRLLSELRDRAARGSVAAGPEAGPGASAAGEALTPTGAEPGAAEGTKDEARTFYEAAQQQFRRGAYETARGGFEDFLENYPGHPLAPDAQYFLAETYAQAGEQDRAVGEYEKVWELYPDSRRAPTALYKRGMIELERGNVSDARGFFQRVQLGYPNSPEAALAEDQLRRLRP
ncbi:MAG: tol-pal system protein YbgF [Gemmatimonadota bacterium]